jgi:hypothetical protein
MPMAGALRRMAHPSAIAFSQTLALLYDLHPVHRQTEHTGLTVVATLV